MRRGLRIASEIDRRKEWMLFFSVVMLLLSCQGALPRGGAGSSLTVASGGSSLTVATGTFDEEQRVAINNLTEAGISESIEERGGAIALGDSDKIEAAVEVTIGNGHSNVGINQDLTVALTVATGLTTASGVISSNAEHASTNQRGRMASLPDYASIYCQLYDRARLGILLKIEERQILEVAQTRVSFAFGQNLSISGFLCMLIVNQNNDEVAEPEVAAAVEPARLSVTTSTIFETVTIGSQISLTLTLQKSGDVDASQVALSGLAAPFTVKGGTYPGTGGTCAATIGGSCTIVLLFSPTTVTSASNTLLISYWDGAQTKVLSVEISGKGKTAAALAINGGSTLDFGSVIVGNTAEEIVTITNSGNTSATGVSGGSLSSGFSFKGGSYPGTGGTCSASIVSTCTVVLVFTPGGSGSAAEVLRIKYFNGAAMQEVTTGLSGTGLAPASLSISDGAIYDFGSIVVSSSKIKQFTITNIGSTPATGIVGSGLAAPFAFPGGFPGTAGDCGTILAVGTSCSIEVRFDPAATTIYSDTIEIDYNDGVANQQVTRAVSGTGITPASLIFDDGGSHDFGEVPATTFVDWPVTLRNMGGGAASLLTFSNIAAPYSIRDNTCIASPPQPDGTCTFTIRFAPTFDSGGAPFAQGMTVEYFDGAATANIGYSMTGKGGPQ